VSSQHRIRVSCLECGQVGGNGSEEDRAAVLETVQRFFGDPHAPAEGLLGGRISSGHDWTHPT